MNSAILTGSPPAVAVAIVCAVLALALLVAARTPRPQRPRWQWECGVCATRYATWAELDAHLTRTAISCCLCGVQRPHHPSCPRRREGHR